MQQSLIKRLKTDCTDFRHKAWRIRQVLWRKISEEKICVIFPANSGIPLDKSLLSGKIICVIRER